VVFSVFWGGCKKKIDRFRPTFLADRKKVGRNSVSPQKKLNRKNQKNRSSKKERKRLLQKEEN